jgi:uncharacterized membrane protein HdeD (DUF308 family)
MLEFKFYENSWIPATKGIFFFIFGLFAFLQTGTYDTLSIFFDVLIILIAILYLTVGFMVKGIKNKPWLVITGFLHLAFGIWLSINYGGSRETLYAITILWIVFSALTDLIEAFILFAAKNVLGALFIINTLVTLSFAFFNQQLFTNFSSSGLTYLGFMAIIVGLVTECTAFILSKTSNLPE